MQRRKFLKAAGVAGVAGAAAATTFAAPAISQGRKKMVVVSTWPRDFPGLGTGAQRVAQRITDMTGGRIEVEYFAAKERVGAFDSFDEVLPEMRRPTTRPITTGKASTRGGPTLPPFRSA